jgi:ceramide glucosyltransferase
MTSMGNGSLAALAPTALSLSAYLAAQAAFALGLRRGRRAPAGSPRQPRVSILKPLAGADDELSANLASFATIDYRRYELLLGVASTRDPAYPVARAFIAAFPAVDARLVVTGGVEACNPKVAQLIALERQATGAILVVSDSNVRVGPQYLTRLVPLLLEPRVGLVSSLCVGTGERSFGAALENLQLTAHVTLTVLAAEVLGYPVSLGKSMAMWRRRLRRVGGFERVASVLAEDYLLGREFARAGFEVRLCTTPVENRNVACSVRRTLERHTRWAKVRRAVEPLCFALEPLLSPASVAAFALLAFPSPATLVGWAVALATQMAFAMANMHALRGERAGWRWALIEIVRTQAALACWILAWATRRVSWRGRLFDLGPGSRIVAVTARPCAPDAPEGWTGDGTRFVSGKLNHG